MRILRELEIKRMRQVVTGSVFSKKNANIALMLFLEINNHVSIQKNFLLKEGSQNN